MSLQNYSSKNHRLIQCCFGHIMDQATDPVQGLLDRVGDCGLGVEEYLEVMDLFLDGTCRDREDCENADEDDRVCDMM